VSDQVPTCPGCADGEARGYARGVEAAAKWLRTEYGADAKADTLLGALLPAPPPQAAGPPETCSMCGELCHYVAQHIEPLSPGVNCYREAGTYAFVSCANAGKVRRGEPVSAPPAAPAAETKGET
jgi:hypothetical protein